MRSIKFRGYDGMDWVYSMTIDYDEENDLCYMLDYKDDQWMMVSKIGQYTGLKDKDDKDIFEGDIVANLRGKRSEINWCDEELGWVAKSKYPNGKDSTLTLADLNSVATIEVVGNIYENPELLTS